MAAFVYAAIDRNEQVLNFCISGGLSSSSTRRGEFSSNGRKGRKLSLNPPWLKKLHWKCQIALKRKSTGQSRSVHVVIPSAEMVILEADQDVEW
ncbi:hypothetical protein ACVWWI_006744 [Bradyrhizobium sp. USDA 3686]|uniref:hypothetical protein n=1 Tax=Bradyrhizobium canariense TaxID=255045 RepID=UPI00195AB87E|nr:hypothetical protein [Bradyrhizobium canariense]MBM7487698.1 hypothetical protein [Bradyrhizobium canariense]MBW5439447.1 hypothetical protein [Bradyrhizobium canariense]